METDVGGCTAVPDGGTARGPASPRAVGNRVKKKLRIFFFGFFQFFSRFFENQNEEKI